jgi:outer membrane protein insertion porin family
VSRARACTAIAILALAAACASAPEDAPRPASAPSVELTVVGSREVDADDLLDAARRELRRFREKGHRPADLDDAAFTMTRRLHADGFAEASVTFRMEPSESDVRRVVFTVAEGPQARLGAVRFEGVQTASEERLRELFHFEGPHLLGVGRPYFRESLIDSAVSDVENLYLLGGHLRVKVGPPRFEKRDGGARIDVIVPVQEGRRYRVRDVTVDIELGPDDEHLRRELPWIDAQVRRAIQGRPFYIRTPMEGAAIVRGALGEEAHLLARARGEAHIDVAAEQDAGSTADVPVDVAIEATPGPRLCVARVEVSGNERTDTDFIREQSTIAPGELLKRSVLDRAVNSLYGTGLFHSVRIRRDIEVNEGPVRAAVLIVDVKESDAQSLDFEAGVGTWELLRGGIRYRDRNVFGLGRDLEARTYASLRSLGADVRLRDGYLLGRSNLIEIGGGYEIREEPSFDTTAALVEASVRHLIDSRTSIRPGYRFRRSNATDVAGEIATEPDGEVSVTSGFFADFRYDGRDDPLLPKSGWFVEAGASISSNAFAADLEFVGMHLAVSRSIELTDDLVLALGVGFETRHILDDEPTLPIQERLFLGGDSSVRSFGESELGPTDADGDPIGGLTALQAHVELRQRLIGDFYGALFYDAGTVGEKSFDIGGPYGHAIGFGLRYYLPVGPIRLDVGFNPGRRFAADDFWAINFSFGFSF